MTKGKLCFKSPMTRLTKIKFAAVLAACAAGIALFVLPESRADSAPDWLRAAAQDSLPEYPKETEAVVLVDEQMTTVNDKGDIETRYRRAYKLLRPEAREHHGAVVVDFDREKKLTYLKSWTISLNGAVIETKEKDAVEMSLTNFAVFSDTKYKVIRFPETNPGSVVGYEYVQKHRPFVFEDHWSFQERIPVRRAFFTLKLPAGWEFSEYWANYAEQKPQTTGSNQFQWEVRDISAVAIEPDMPPLLAVAGRMDLKYFPRDPALREKTTGTWIDLGIWYEGLTVSSRNDTPAIKQKVTELTAGAATPLEKMKALAAYVQEQIRYVAIEIGIGGFRPHNATDVFTNQYGDCKDKATLLSTMLGEVGIESYYVLIDTRRGIVVPDFPSTRFNHAILAVRVPDEVPDTTLFAITKDPKLGRLLFFDPTNKYVPLGYLPSYLQDNYGLVMVPGGGQLVRLPLLPASVNRLLRTAKLNLSEAGNLNGEVQEVRWGGPAITSREQFLNLPPEKRSKVIESLLGNSLTNFTVTSVSAENLEKYDRTLTLDYKFVAEGYAKTAGNLLILRPRVVGAKGSNLLAGKQRKYPIEFSEATRQDDIFDITLPAGYVVDELPRPVNVACAYGSYKSEITVTDNTLHYTRTYEIKDILVPTEKLDEVRTFFKQIAADERSTAVLRRVN
jgi:transglutaminase-like putative cysteine protease